MGLTKKYPLCGTLSNLFLFFYSSFNPLRKEKEEIKLSKNPAILLCSRANLGDLFLACLLIPSLKKHFPGSKIGFLCAKEGSFFLKNQPAIDRVHVAGFWDLLLGKAYRRLQEENYEISLELHPFFPGSIPLCKKAKIRNRVGFDAGGFDQLLTKPISFPQKLEYLPTLYKDLLKALEIDFEKPGPSLFSIPDIDLKKKGIPEKYIVLHVGTSNPLKEWELFKWKELAFHLQKRGFSLVFTGKGKREKKHIETSLGRFGLSLCDELSLEEFIKVIQKSSGVISVDSLPIHVAAFYEKPLIGLYLYNKFLEMWIPVSPQSAFLVSGCKKQYDHPNALYLSTIEVSDVLKKTEDLFLI